MPFEIVQDANSVVWNEVRFDPHLTTPVPELGTVRLVRSERKQNTASWIRWGIYHIEHLQQMASAALETAKFDVLYTLLQAHDMEKKWEVEHGRFKGRRVDDMLSKDIWMFAALQKYKRPLNQLETYVNETMNKYGGRADSWILPPQIINYMSIVPDEYLEQRKIGATGPSIVLDGPRPYGMIAQNRVYIARTYHTAQFTGRENILEHQREIGEYYKMFDRNPDTCVDYCSRNRHIQIYNEDNNSWFEVGLRWALDNCLLFNEDGTPRRLGSGDYQSRLSGVDADLDIFSYVEMNKATGQHEPHQAKMFGELPDFYFSARDKIGWAGTARLAMQRDFGDAEFKTMETAYNAGVDLLQRIDDLPWSKPAEIELLSRFSNADNAGTKIEGGAADPTGYSTRTTTAVHRFKEFKQSDLFITGTGSRQGADLDTLLPGLQSEPGLRYIIAKGSAQLAEEKTIAKNFIAAISRITRALRKYTQNSVFLNKSTASSWFWTPTDETTYVENLVMPYRPPLFMTITPARTLGGTVAAARTVNYVQTGITSIASRLPAEVRYTATPVPVADSKVAWFRYWAATSVSSLIQLADPTILAAELQLKFGGSAAAPMVKNFNASYGSNTVAGEAKNIAGLLFALAETNPAAFKGIFTLEIAEGVINTVTEHFNTVWAKYTQSQTDIPANLSVRTGLDARALEGFYRSALLVSPTFAATLYNEITTNGVRGVLPAHPDFPEVPIDLNTFDKYTEHLGVRVGGDKTQANLPANLRNINPAWVSRVTEQLHGAISTTFMANALSLEIGHSMDSSDFTGVQVESQLVGAHFGMAGAGTRRSATARQLKMGVVHKTLLDPYQRQGLSATAEKHIGDANRMMSANFLKSWSDINELAGNHIDRALAHVFDTVPITYQALSRFIDNDLRFPIGFYITRPHMTYRMLYGIKVLAGKEMGMTLMKPGLFEIGDDAATQAHIGTYTYYSKALVKNHNHVYIAKSIFCNGYDGGTGVRPINPADYQAANGNYTGQSIIVLAVPFRDEIDGILSLTGRLTLGEYEEYDLTVDGDLQYLTAAFYNEIFGWNSARVDDQFETQPYDGVLERRFNNVLCHRGHQFYFNPMTKTFNIVSEGKGHFDIFTYLGCDKARAGMNVEFKRPDWTGYTHA